MTRIGLALLAVAGAVLFAGAAQAKAPPGGVDVCGPSACAHLGMTDAERLWIGQTGSMSAARTTPGAFYILRWSWSPGENDSAYLVPSSAAIRWNSGSGHSAAWTGLDATTLDLVRRVAAGIESYPTPTLTRVTVGGREVAEPQTYLQLFAGKLTWKQIGGRWWTVRLESAAPSPWTDGSLLVRVSRTTRTCRSTGCSSGCRGRSCGRPGSASRSPADRQPKSVSVV